jgi:hypothetical protein
MSSQAARVEATKEFFAIVDKTYEILARHGFKRRVPVTPVADRLNAQTAESLHQIMDSMRTFNEILLEAEGQNYKIVGDRRLVWLMLRRYGFRPPSNLFSLLEDGDVVEVYALDGRQIYRSFEFMAVSSYSIEDVVLNDFATLWERDEKITQMIWTEGVSKLATHSEAFAFEIPVHIGRESISRNRHELEIQFKMASPLYTTGPGPAAVLVTASVKLVGKLGQ